MGEIEKLPTLELDPYVPKKFAKTERTVTCLWGDWHIGSNMLPQSTGTKFGPVEEARAVAQVVKTLLEYKTDHRDQTTEIKQR